MITQRIGADNVAVSIREIAASVSPIVQHRAVSIATVASELSAKMQEMETPDYRAITTGISGIDDIVGPMQPGYLVVIGGRTGAGKTALALSLAVHMDRSAIVYSREMPRLQICERVLSIVGQIPLSAYRVLDDYYRWSDRIHQAAMSPVSDRIMVHGATRSTIDDIVSTGCVHPRPEIVVVDYVQLYADAGGENRATEIGRVMHRLKDLALQGYIVIALSQLSRESARPGAERRPGLADLRESGDIEQDADVVLLIDRRENMSKIVVAKNRHGRTGDAEVRWIGESATWV
jgi:replicative DNA helicase